MTPRKSLLLSVWLRKATCLHDGKKFVQLCRNEFGLNFEFEHPGGSINHYSIGGHLNPHELVHLGVTIRLGPKAVKIKHLIDLKSLYVVDKES